MNISEEELISLIETICDQRIKKASSNFHYIYSGKIKSVDGSGKFTVEIPSDGSTYTDLYNRTGTTLSVGDSVEISVKGNKGGNGYISTKKGVTVDGV